VEERLRVGYAVVRLETAALLQKREEHVAGAEGWRGLRELLWSEFGPVLRGKRAESMLVLCECLCEPEGEGGEGVTKWHVVTKESDLPKVLERASLKFIEKPRHHSEVEPAFDIAFPLHAPRSSRRGGGRRSGSRCERVVADERSAREGGRFDDDDEEGEGGGDARFVDDEEGDGGEDDAKTSILSDEEEGESDGSEQRAGKRGAQSNSSSSHGSGYGSGGREVRVGRGGASSSGSRSQRSTVR